MKKYFHKDDTFRQDIDFEHLEKLQKAIPLLLDALGLQQKEYYNVGAQVYCQQTEDGEPARVITADLPDEHDIRRVRIIAIVEYGTPGPDDCCHIRAKKATIKPSRK